MYDDIYREKPISAGIAGLNGIKLAHTLTTPVFMEYFMQRMGLSKLMDDLGLDFVISDTLVRNQKYFALSKSMGYGLTNVDGVRFALVSSIKDSLTMDDQVRLTLLQERSDVLWVIDNALLRLAPSLIRFHISERVLSDTSMSVLRTKIDTTRLLRISDFRRKIDGVLNRKINIVGRVDDHLFSIVAQRETLDVVIYPPKMFGRIFEGDSVSLRGLMEIVAFETKFKKAIMDSAAISQMCEAHAYSTWGTIRKRNVVLAPDTAAGRRIFDYYYERGGNED